MDVQWFSAPIAYTLLIHSFKSPHHEQEHDAVLKAELAVAKADQLILKADNAVLKAENAKLNANLTAMGAELDVAQDVLATLRAEQQVGASCFDGTHGLTC